MTTDRAIEVLTQFNLWRRDDEGIYEAPEPREIGQAIDTVIKYFGHDKNVVSKKQMIRNNKDRQDEKKIRYKI